MSRKCFHRSTSSPFLPTMARKISSSVGCFSMYSTFAGGNSCLSSSRVPLAMILPVVQDGDPVRELFGFVEILRGQQDRRAAAGELLDGFPDLEPALRVESGRRLVEEDDRGRTDQAHGDVEPAGHAAGVRVHPLVGRVGQPELLQQAVGNLGRDWRRPAVWQSSTRFSRPVRMPSTAANWPVRLMLLAHSFRLARGVEAADAGGAAVGLEQRRKDVDHRRLAGAVRSEQREDLAAPHLEVDALQDLGLLEGLRQALRFDGNICHGFFSSSGVCPSRRGSATYASSRCRSWRSAAARRRTRPRPRR